MAENDHFCANTSSVTAWPRARSPRLRARTPRVRQSGLIPGPSGPMLRAMGLIPRQSEPMVRASGSRLRQSRPVPGAMGLMGRASGLVVRAPALIARPSVRMGEAPALILQTRASPARPSDQALDERRQTTASARRGGMIPPSGSGRSAPVSASAGSTLAIFASPGGFLRCHRAGSMRRGASASRGRYDTAPPWAHRRACMDRK